MTRGRELVAKEGQPLVAGILNVTPDSFFDGGKYLNVDRAVMTAGLMTDAGAAIIDIGGASSRPKGQAYGAGAEVVAPEVELKRILPVVEILASDFPEITISIDTYHPDVAEACLAAGAHIINDITALRLFSKTADIVAQYEAAIILMHSTGRPGQMPHVARDGDVATAPTPTAVLQMVRDDLAAAVEIAERAGVVSIITDPGFGFGKSTDANFALIRDIESHRVKDHPVMIGVSRKTSIGVALGDEQFPVPSFERLFGSLGATAIGALRGAAIVRTHDVGATAQMIRVMAVTEGMTVDSNHDTIQRSL